MLGDEGEGEWWMREVERERRWMIGEGGGGVDGEKEIEVVNVEG